MKNIVLFINESINKKDFIGKDFMHVFKIFDDSVSANKVTLNIDDEKMWIKSLEMSGKHTLHLTTNKSEASKYSFNKNHNQIENVYIDDYQNTEFYKKYNRLGPEHIDVIYGLKDNDMLLWISDIKGNTIYLKYTKYSEIE